MIRFLRKIILPFSAVAVCGAVAIVLFIDWAW